MDNNIKELTVSLMNSNWPKTEKIAEELFNIGGEDAKKALLEGLNGKRHAIRTACIHYLAKFNDESMVDHFRKHLNDSSYETRMEAKNAIKSLTGEDVLTARGE